MALSDDQKAMLRLLAQREGGYEDLAALMGLSVEEVRAKVKDALAQLDEGEVAPPLPPEPVKVEEPAAVEPPPEPEPTPTPPFPPAAAAPSAKRAPSSPPRLSLPAGKGARAAIASGLAVVVLVVVVLAVGGGGSGSTTATTSTTSTAGEGQTTTPTVDGKEVTEAHLTAVDGSGASGTALFGRVKNSLALEVEAEGLEPSARGQGYTIWLAQSPQKMLPLASTSVGKSGKIASQFKVPTEVLNYLAAGTFDQLAITRTGTAALKASLTKATSEKKAPAYTGTAVLRGTVVGPIVGAAKKQKQE